MTHLDSVQLVDYLSGHWTPDQERSIEIHLAGCDQCTSLARKIFADAYVFDEWNVDKTAKVVAEVA